MPRAQVDDHGGLGSASVMVGRFVAVLHNPGAAQQCGFDRLAKIPAGTIGDRVKASHFMHGASRL